MTDASNQQGEAARRDGLPRLAPGAHIRRVGAAGGESAYFVLDPDKPSWVVVNESGMEVLRQCDGRTASEDIAGRLAERHPSADIGAWREGVEAFLNRLEPSRLLQEVQAPPEEDPNPFHGIALEITARCNLRCRHCYLAAGLAWSNELTFNEIRRVLDDTRAVGGISVAIGGGEPLMREDCYRIVEYALDRELLVSLGTNGTLIDDAVAPRLARLPIKLQISLDGAGERTHDRIRGRGSFAATVRGIERLCDKGKAKDIVIAFTPMKPNVGDLRSVIDFALAHGIPVVQFPPLSLSGRARRHEPELLLSEDETIACWNTIAELAEQHRGRIDLLADCFSMSIRRIGEPCRCTIGSQFRVDPGGDVYPCQCFHAGEDFRLGNVRTTRLADMVAGPKIAAIKQLAFERRDRIPECRACPLRNICGSGCMARAYDRYGTILKPTDCDLRRRWIEGLFEAEFPGPAPAVVQEGHSFHR